MRKKILAGLGRSVETQIDRTLINHLYEETIWADSNAAPVITEYLQSGRQVAIVSNSTSFWFPRQVSRLGLTNVEHRLMRFLSHETGVAKSHEQGGLKQLASRVKPEGVLYIDDRLDNVAVAHKLGMRVPLQKRGIRGSCLRAKSISR